MLARNWFCDPGCGAISSFPNWAFQNTMVWRRPPTGTSHTEERRSIGKPSLKIILEVIVREGRCHETLFEQRIPGFNDLIILYSFTWIRRCILRQYHRR
ncbi:hypothetical protein DESC_380010 [Desulfosarcina cetonica]|nr:hypothetical protein DESC_380010 [Desulfosarcina cetonica]